MGQSADEVRREIEQTRAQMGYTIDEIGDRVSPRRIMERRTDRVRSTFRDVRENVMGTAEYGASRVASVPSGVASGVSDVASSAADTISGAPAMAKRQTAGNPLAAGLIAFGGGVLLASLLPKTNAESQMANKLAPALEPVKEQAKAAGQQLSNELSSSVSEAGEHVKERAAEAAEQVKEEASHATERVTDQARSAADEVKRP